MTLSSNNNVNAPRINTPRILLPDQDLLTTTPELIQNKTSSSDIFLTLFQQPNATPLPNTSSNTVQHPTGLATTQVNENIRFLITNLNLQLHSSGNYFTSTRNGSNPNDRYYPQLNGTFFVTGTTPQGETVQSTITNFLNGEPVRSAANIPLQHTLLLGQLRTFTANGFNFNANGTLTSPLHNGVTFHRQLDGSLWGSNNTTYRLASNGTSVEQQTGTTPLTFTTFFSQMGIQPLRLATAAPGSTQVLGAFLRPNDPGMYILEPGGTVFYTGREVPGQGRLGPYVYRQLPNGAWEIDQTTNRNTPLPGAIALANTRAYQDASGNWSALNDAALAQCNGRSIGNGNWQYFQPGSQWEGAHGDTIRVLPDGRLFGLTRNPSGPNVAIFEDGAWRVIGTRNGNQFVPQAGSTFTPQMITAISGHIQEILQSRERTGYSHIRGFNLRDLGRGNHQYFRPGSGCEGDTVRFLDNGLVVGLRANPTNNEVVVFQNGEWRAIGTRGPDGTFTPNDQFNVLCQGIAPQSITDHVQAINESRNRTGYLSLYACRARPLGNGNWSYHQPGWEGAHNDTIRQLSNGTIIGLSRNPTDNRVMIFNQATDDWTSIGTRDLGTGAFTANGNFGGRCPGIQANEVTGHIQAILTNRRARNVFQPPRMNHALQSPLLL